MARDEVGAAEVVAEVGGKPVTRAELLAAFNRVCSPHDWRGPIAAVARVDDLPMVEAAVEFFTATKLVKGDEVMPGWFAVRAVGYRAGPAGDH